MVVVGATFPLAPGAYTVTLFAVKSATCTARLESRAIPIGWLRPVIAPVIVLIGVALP
jgi:hypothetical protein